MKNPSKAMNITSWIFQVLLALTFLMSGVTKLMGDEMHVENFQRWFWPDQFFYVVGAVELASVVLLLIPKTSFYGALLLCATMAGASFTHIYHGEWQMLVVTLILFALAAFVAFIRKPEKNN